MNERVNGGNINKRTEYFIRENTFCNQSHTSVKYAQEEDYSVPDQTLLSTSSFVAIGYLTLVV